MKIKEIILIIWLIAISWCSFIDENNIEKTENINIETFLKNQSNIWNIDDNKNSETTENIKLNENVPKNNDLNKNITENNDLNNTETQNNSINIINKEILIENDNIIISEPEKMEPIELDETDIEEQKMEEEFNKLIDILFEVSN